MTEKEWERQDKNGVRIYKKTVGYATIVVSLSDVYKDSTSRLPSLAVSGEWWIEGQEDKTIPVRDTHDEKILGRLDQLIARQIAIKMRRDLHEATRGGEIIKKKGRPAVKI